MRPEMLTTCWKQERYDDFWLTEAVRPSPEDGVIPREGYRAGLFHDRRRRRDVPMLLAAVSRERLFDAFLELTESLHAVVDVVFEGSHDATTCRFRRERIDLPILQSYCCEHEELLLNDGCTGVTVIDRVNRLEVHFDEHKLFILYGYDLTPFEHVLRDNGIRRDNRLRLITEAEHLHSTHSRYADEFEQLCYHVGAVDPSRFRVSSF